MDRNTTRLAKISRPSQTGILSRERLFSRLDSGREKSIVWLTGPPGSGKTTLVADYLDTWAVDYVWYQVDQGDSDVATFFHYISQALPKNGDHPPLPAFTPEFQNDLAAFSHRFFRDLFARLTPPFALVFDNYQDSPAQSRLHEVIRDGLSEIPDQGCVIFISRGDPTSTMARFQANQAMDVIGWDDLRLTRDESDAITRMKGHELTEDARKQLFEKTEGWTAGLILMLGRVGSNSDVSELPASGTPQVIFDYLAGELLADFKPETQNFLLRCAALPQMTAKQAASLTKTEDAEPILKNMADNDYLVSTRATTDEVIYVFHPLLREFLLQRAEDTLSEEERAELKHSAARLLEESGQIEDTVDLRIQSRDWDELARIINANAQIMLDQGRGETLEQWIEELPGELLDKDPWCLRWLAACRFPYSPRESRRLNEAAFDLFDSADEKDIAGLFASCAAVLDAIVFDLDDLSRADRWIDEVTQLIEQYPEYPNEEIEARITCNMYMAMVFRQPSHKDIEYWGRRTGEISQQLSDPTLKHNVDQILASSCVWTGRFQMAKSVIDNMLAKAQSIDISPVALSTLRNVEAMYYMTVGECDECIAAVREGMKVADSTGVKIWRNSTILFGVAGALGAGDLKLAEELIAEIDRVALPNRRFDLWWMHYNMAWQAMLENDVLRAHQELRNSRRIANDMGLPFFKTMSNLALAQVLLKCGDERKCIALMSQIRDAAKHISNRLFEFVSLVNYADIAIQVGRKKSGLNALRYAFGLGREKSYYHYVWWQPQVIANLCVIALEEGIEVDYVKELILRRGIVPDRAPLNIPEWPWACRIRTFGQFDLECNTTGTRAKSGGKPLDLLKTTIAFGARDVPIERIADVLWPNIDSDYAHRSFNTTLHRLRKQLGDDRIILLNQGQLSLNDKMVWLDVWAFDQAITEFSQAIRYPDDFDAIAPEQLAEEIMEAYRGPFLSGNQESWAIPQQEQMRNRFVRFIGDVGHHFSRIGQPEKAIDFYHRGIDADEMAEGLYRKLMLAFRDLNRIAEAIETYNRCKRTLNSALEIDPSTETMAIYESLMDDRKAKA